MGEVTFLSVIACGLLVMAAQRSPGQAPPRDSGPISPAASARDFFEEPNWQVVCTRATAGALPADAATLALAARGRSSPPGGKCGEEQALYYGLGKRPDYGAALQCAYWHRAHPDVQAGLLDGAGTLSMLYANGEGVPRSYALAIRFACEADDHGGQNTEQRIGRLEALRDGRPVASAHFDLCDEQMSGVMGGYCADLEERKADVLRARRTEALEERLPEPAIAMLPRLQAAERAFEQARIQGEYTGGGGSGSLGFALGDQNRLREQFVLNLGRFSKGNVPKATAADRERVNRDLNAAYRAVRAIPAAGPDEPAFFAAPPTPQGFAATEAAWQGLFDEWMRFVPVAFPTLSQDSAATELLRLRLHQLKSLAR